MSFFSSWCVPWRGGICWFLPHFGLWNVLRINAIKRLTLHLKAFRATFPPPGKNIFFGPQVVRPQWLKMMQYEVGMKKKMKKSLRKVCRFRKSAYLCNPVTKQGHLTEADELSWRGLEKRSGRAQVQESSLKRLKKVQGSKYQNTKNESVNFLKELEVPDWTWRIRNIQRRVWSWLRMNASGRLNTCKSRGSVGQQCSDGDRRKGA